MAETEDLKLQFTKLKARSKAARTVKSAAQRRVANQAKAAAAGKFTQPETEKRYKGKYAGPDKYKGVIPEHLKGKYKGKYFGKEERKGANYDAPSKAPAPDIKDWIENERKLKPGPGKPGKRIPGMNFKKKPITGIPNPDMNHAGDDPTKRYAL